MINDGLFNDGQIYMQNIVAFMFTFKDESNEILNSTNKLEKKVHLIQLVVAKTKCSGQVLIVLIAPSTATVNFDTYT